jgi:AcrR family transcriptional regulator
MVTTDSVRGPYAKTAERRREILDAAVRVFSASGYRKGSLRDVADLVGMSQAGLLHHYPTKHALLEAVLTWRDEEALARIDPAARGVSRLRALVAQAQHNETTPELVELHVATSAEGTAPNHPVHDYFVRRYATVCGMVREAFEQAAEDGVLREGTDCASAARTAVAVWDGVQIQWLLDKESIDMADELRRYLQSFVTVPL